MPLLLLLWMLKPEVSMGSYISLISFKKVVYVSWLSQFWFELQQLHHTQLDFRHLAPCSYLVFFVLYYKFQTEFFSAWTYGPRVKHIGHKSMQKKKKRIFHNLQYGLRKQVIHLTPMSDQDRISPHHINTISSRQVMQIKRNIN